MLQIKIVLIAMVLQSSMVFARGTESSGGGNAVVCRNSDSSIRSAQLLDLYEGQVRDGMVFPSAKTTNAAMTRLYAIITDSFVIQDLNMEINGIVGKMVMLAPGARLRPSEDLGDGAIFWPAGCDLEGVGFYENTGRLVIASDVFKGLDPVNRAAFFTHEAVYKMARERNLIKNSQRVRTVIAQMFVSGAKFDNFKNEFYKLEGKNGFANIYRIVPATFDLKVEVRDRPRNSLQYDIELFCSTWPNSVSELGRTTPGTGDQSLSVKVSNCNGILIVGPPYPQDTVTTVTINHEIFKFPSRSYISAHVVTQTDLLKLP